jgi:hypothetical protein
VIVGLAPINCSRALAGPVSFFCAARIAAAHSLQARPPHDGGVAGDGGIRLAQADPRTPLRKNVISRRHSAWARFRASECDSLLRLRRSLRFARCQLDCTNR